MDRLFFEDREAIIVFPEKVDPRKRWVLKTEYFEAFQDLEEKLVECGFYLAYLRNNNRWGTNDDLDAKKRFATMLSDKYDLNSKCVMIGMSCGGLHAIKQAARYPDMAAVLYLDAPVVNLLSCPFRLGTKKSRIEESTKQEALDALGLDMSGLIAYRDHPLDKLPKLLDHRIPVILVWGEEDTIVPFEENGKYVLDCYANTTVPFISQSKPRSDHHPHGPRGMKEVVDFIMLHA